MKYYLPIFLIFCIICGCERNNKYLKVKFVHVKLINAEITLPSNYTVKYFSDSTTGIITNGTCQFRFTDGYFNPQLLEDNGVLIKKEKIRSFNKVIKYYYINKYRTIALYIWDTTSSTKLFGAPRFNGGIYTAQNITKKQSDTILKIFESVQPRR